MRIAVTGSSGFIGEALTKWFAENGHSVTRIVRPSSNIKVKENIVLWDPKRGEINAAALEGHDVVVNLAGENIAKKRWNKLLKELIWESRVGSTEFLSKTLANLERPPEIFMSASATGYYGDQGLDDELDESNEAGDSFRSKLCVAWERATEDAELAGIRVLHLRVGIVIGKRGGTLARVLPVFKMGLGSQLGSGKQAMSWIAVDEIPSIVAFLIKRRDLKGPVNLVAPNPVTNREFTRMLGRVLKRPAFLVIPEFVLKLIYGELARELLLSGSKVIPRKLQDTGYKFNHPNLESFLSVILG